MAVENSDVLAQSYTEFTNRLAFFAQCDAYAHGASLEVFSDLRTRGILRLDEESPYVFNFSGIPLRVISHRLNVSSFTVPNDTGATDRCAELWQENKLYLYEHGFIFDILKYGVSYASVWPGEDGTAAISFESPLNCRVFYDEGSQTPTHAIKSWRERRGLDWIARVNLYFTDHIEKYYALVADGVPIATADWMELEEEDWYVPNPYGFIPIEPFHTIWPYGEPEHKPAWPVQDAVNKLVATHMGVVDALGLPIRYLLMDPASPEGTSDLSLLEGNPGGTPDPFSGSPGSESIKARPGDILALRAKQAGTFEAANSSQFIEPLKYYVSLLSPLTDIPLKYWVDPGQMPAEGSSMAADAPLRSRIANREMSFGYSFGELLKKALIIEKRDVPTVITHWQPQEVEMGRNFWEGAQIMRSLGVPMYYIAKSAGIPEQTLQSWNLSEDSATYSPQQTAGGSTQLSADGLDTTS
ncbi:hypothetical protein ACIBSW_34525 [Actinoplanes sp. NPDC049668]|uniref:hypothetical protein n=1 Tax=unclassified Actinoplanes TaxID=2626549 RepID=UPI0033A3F195